MSNSQARVDEVLAEAARLFANKNVTYQDSWRTQGWRGNLSRILEKTGRLRAMLWRGGNVLLNGSNEHPRETCIDMINTLAFLVINMDDGVEWGHEDQAKEIKPPLDMPQWVQDGTQIPPWVPQPEETQIQAHVGEVPPEGVNEQTLTNIPVPGEEQPKPSPTPRKVNVEDRGSGPRKRPARN